MRQRSERLIRHRAWPAERAQQGSAFRGRLTRHRAAIAIAVVLAITGIGACTSSGSGGAKSAARANSAAAGNFAEAAPDARSVARGSASAPNKDAAGDLALTSSKIRTANMTVAVKHGDSVAAVADTAEAIVARTGGEVDADERTSGAHASATLVLRVPPDRLTAVLEELSRLGVEKSRQLSVEDVTSKVADVASRVNSARVAIARLRDLYQHATKVSDVIDIESELSGRESDLESLEAQQRSLAAQTATAAITLSLISRAAVKPVVKHHHRGGFVGGLQNGWDAFSHGAYALTTALGAALPFAVLLLGVGLIGRLLWPRLRPVREPAPAAAPPE